MLSSDGTAGAQNCSKLIGVPKVILELRSFTVFLHFKDMMR